MSEGNKNRNISFVLDILTDITCVLQRILSLRWPPNHGIPEFETNPIHPWIVYIYVFTLIQKHNIYNEYEYIPQTTATADSYFS